jgi:nucleoid-associated protein YgaU
MRTAAKVRLLLGVVLVVAAIIYLPNIVDKNSGELAENEPPTTDTPSKIAEAEQVPEQEPEIKAEPDLEPATDPRQEQAPEPPPEPAAETRKEPAPEPQPVPELAPDPVLDPEPVPQAEAVDRSPRYYTVKPGDTLYRISKSVYGEDKYWKAIYQANKNVITTPNTVQPGWKLRLPPPEQLGE